MRSFGMKPRFPPAHYVRMATNVRSIADSIEEPETRAMVMEIAADYERLAREAGGGKDGARSLAQPQADGQDPLSPSTRTEA